MIKYADFQLSDSFVDTYKNTQPNWGPIGYFTYKRTYARPLGEGITEEFWQTCKRVVEGVYRVQKSHCLQHNLPWSDTKAQRSAQEMFTRMWAFKWLPPGRGLWVMGTDIIEHKGGAALNNCAFVSTQNLYWNFADPFCFLMDMSMLGVGVGGDTLGADTIALCKPMVDKDLVFVVEDSREGWVDLIRHVLNSYVGKNKLAGDIDYSGLRPKGAPLKGFGGFSAGPDPLIELVDNIHKVLDIYQKSHF